MDNKRNEQARLFGMDNFEVERTAAETAILHFFEELTDLEKRLVAKYLEFPFKYNNNLFPKLLYRKELRKLYRSGLSKRETLFRAIIMINLDLLSLIGTAWKR
jgi:hypothetical protein